MEDKHTILIVDDQLSDREVLTGLLTGQGYNLTFAGSGAEALAKAVLELKENPSLARTMGENGRKYVETEASLNAIGLRIKDIFQQLIA